MAKKRVIVHFGANVNFTPLYHSVPEGEFHIAYDPDYSNPSGVLQTLHGKISRGSGYILRARDARETGLKTQSAEEVHISDVLDHPAVIDHASDLLREAARIVKPNGVIYVQHAITPKICPSDKLREMAAKHGLKTEILIENHGSGRAFIAEERRILEATIKETTFSRACTGYFLAKLTKE